MFQVSAMCPIKGDGVEQNFGISAGSREIS
jgi:hypothetical protein